MSGARGSHEAPPETSAATPARTLGERAYRLLLRAYPRSFRRAHQEAMVRFWRERREDLGRSGRMAGGLRLAAETIVDLVPSVIREHRRAGSTPGLAGTALADLRFAVRSLTSRPTFALTVIATLALGIGANVGVFALVDAVLLEPLPYPESDRLVRVRQQNSSYVLTLSMADVLAVEESQRSFSAFGALYRTTLDARAEGGETIEAAGAWITAGLIGALGLDVVAGRSLSPADNAPGAEATTLVSWSLAERLFVAPERAPGGTVLLDGIPYSVAGVLPTGLHDLAGVRGDVWPAMTLAPPPRRGPFGYVGIARLADGVTLEAAATDLASISRRLFPIWADTFQDEEATLVPVSLRETLVGSVRQPLLALLGAVMIVLTIGLANIANLMLARSTTRQRELGVRAALGASAGRLTRLLVTEGLLLGATGGAVGLGLAVLIVRGFASAGPRIPRLDEAGVDGSALALAAALAVTTGLVMGAISILALRRPLRWLRSGDRGTGTGTASETLRNALVVGEFALALPLLVAAALLIVSLLNLATVALGFEPDRLVAARVRLPEAAYAEAPAVLDYWQRVPQVIGAVAGIESVGLMTGVPPDSPRWYNNFDLADKPVETGAPQPVSPWSQIAPGALATLGVPLLEGRGLTVDDDSDSGAVALVSESWARRFYPGESPVGREMYAGGCTPDTCGSVTIVGVVGDVKFDGLDAASEAIYTPLLQEPSRTFWVVARTSGPPAAVVPELTRALESLDATLPAPAWVGLRERVDAALATPRAWTLLLSAFASVAVALAAVGVFGVLTYLVGRRRPEIGIRMALGADALAVQRMVVGAGLRRTLLGLAIGGGLTFWLDRLVGRLLFEVRAGDPAILTATAGALVAVACLAAWLPARRAARTDAARVIRAD